MKIETTIENKKRFFALYWGQRVLRHQSANHWNPEVNEYCVSLINDGHYLNLKPLSTMSDQDAIEVAKAVNHRAFVTHKKWKVDHVENGDASYVKVFSKLSHDVVTIDYDGRIEILDWGTGEVPAFCLPEYLYGYDFLRSRGYALPWMGISVEELISAGWVKLIDQ